MLLIQSDWDILHKAATDNRGWFLTGAIRRCVRYLMQDFNFLLDANNRLEKRNTTLQKELSSCRQDLEEERSLALSRLQDCEQLKKDNATYVGGINDLSETVVKQERELVELKKLLENSTRSREADFQKIKDIREIINRN